MDPRETITRAVTACKPCIKELEKQMASPAMRAATGELGAVLGGLRGPEGLREPRVQSQLRKGLAAVRTAWTEQLRDPAFARCLQDTCAAEAAPLLQAGRHVLTWLEVLADPGVKALLEEARQLLEDVQRQHMATVESLGLLPVKEADSKVKKPKAQKKSQRRRSRR